MGWHLIVSIILMLLFFLSCRDQLKRHYNRREYWVQIDVKDLSDFDSVLSEKLTKLPADYLPLVRDYTSSKALKVVIFCFSQERW